MSSFAGWRSSRLPCIALQHGLLRQYNVSACDYRFAHWNSAKTDCFVGFLPHHALAKIIERRPIVLLTLAKRLLSLLSPLGMYFPIK